jgi:hypothetical protein
VANAVAAPDFPVVVRNLPVPVELETRVVWILQVTVDD